MVDSCDHKFTLRLCLFWRKTISGNDFTPHCVFGCAWKIKFFGKTFPLTVCFMVLTRKLVYIFIFTTNHFRVSDAQREREREREISSLTPLSHGTLHPLSHALLSDRTSKHRRVASQHRRDRATNPRTDRPTTFRSTHLVHRRVTPMN